jgi:FMN phosphatase YigB (HAD superfamily)
VTGVQTCALPISHYQLWELGEDLWKRFDKRKGDPGDLEQDYWCQFVQHPRCPPSLRPLPPPTFIDKTDAFIRSVNAGKTIDLLEWLVAKGVHLGICSNNNEFWFLRQAMKLGLYRFLCPSHVTLSCHHGVTKGDAKHGDFWLFLIAAHSLGLHPTECVFVDDRPDNVFYAVQCDMTGVLFPTEQLASKPQHGTEYVRRLLEAILV